MNYERYLKESRFQAWGQQSGDWPTFTIGEVCIYDFSKVAEKNHEQVTLALKKKHPTHICSLPTEEDLVEYLRGAGVTTETHKKYKRFCGLWIRTTNLRFKKASDGKG